MRVYLAGPLFSEAEQTWHMTFKKQLEESGHHVIWPFELISAEQITQWGQDAPRQIMKTDSKAIDASQVVIALLDGTQVDDGTAWEIGYAYAKDIPVIGIRTDFRNAGDTIHSAVNAMIEGSCLCILRSRQEVIERLKTMQK